MSKPALVFDLDNTLLPCDPRYTQANEVFARFLCATFADLGDPAAARAAWVEYDHGLVNSGYLGNDRFPKGMRSYLLALASERGMQLPEESLAHAEWIGGSVFRDPYPLFDGVYEMLASYREAGYLLALATKGDPDIQWRLKIRPNRLDQVFHLISVFETRKGEAEFRTVRDAMNASGARGGYVIGDSLRDDIAGGKAAGMKTVLVQFDAHSWSYNTHNTDGVTPDHAIASVLELPSIVPVPVTQRSR